MLCSFVLFYILAFVCKKIYVYDSDPVEFDTDMVGQAQFYITENEGVYISTLDTKTQAWTQPTPLVGMGTKDFMALNTGGTEQFGLKSLEAQMPLYNPYVLDKGTPPDLVVIQESEMPCATEATGSGASTKKTDAVDGKKSDTTDSKNGSTVSKNTKSGKTKNSAPEIGLFPLVALIVLTSTVL